MKFLSKLSNPEMLPATYHLVYYTKFNGILHQKDATFIIEEPREVFAFQTKEQADYFVEHFKPGQMGNFKEGMLPGDYKWFKICKSFMDDTFFVDDYWMTIEVCNGCGSKLQTGDELLCAHCEEHGY